MISIIFLLSTALLTQASPSVFDLGNGDTRIVGGSDAKKGEFPYMGSIWDAKYNEHLCGCSIITMQHVLTAAHCFYKRGPANVTVRVGSHKLDAGGIFHTVVKITVHEEYNMRNSDNDIAIVMLSKNFTLSKYVQLIKISATEPRVGDEVVLCGHGFTEYPNNITVSNTLQKLTTKVFPMDECKEIYKYDPNGKSLSHKFLCTLTLSKGFCSGDSGSPIVNKKREQVGFGTWSYQCAFDKPDVYVKVVAYRKWIEDNSQYWWTWD